MVFDSSAIVVGLSLSESNSSLVLQAARAGEFARIALPELVIEESSTVMQRIYGRKAAYATRVFLLRLCTIIPRGPRLTEEIERARGVVPDKDLEVLAAVRVMQADRLVPYDRHFQGLKEYRTPKRMVEDLGFEPYNTEY